MDNSRFQKLLDQRAESVESTRRDIDKALERFEQGKLQNLPASSKLTLRNLAIECGHSKDTPLSRYPRGHQKAGEYRFPEIASRIKKLRNNATRVRDKESEIHRVRRLVRELKRQLILSARVNNLLDAENLRLKRRNSELEKENAQFRQQQLKIVL